MIKAKDLLSVCESKIRVGDKVFVPTYDDYTGDFTNYDDPGMAKVLKINGDEAELEYTDGDPERFNMELSKLRKA